MQNSLLPSSHSDTISPELAALINERITRRETELAQVREEVRSEQAQRAVADDIPGWDSLSHTILMLTIEQEFGIELASSTAYSNVGDLVEVIAGKI